MKKQYLYAAISIFSWSTVATITKLLLDQINNIQLLWASSFLAFIFLLFINIFTGKLKLLKEQKPKDYLISVFIGLPGTFFYYIFYYFGASKLPASQAFIINYLWPIMSVIFATIILKQKMTWPKILAISISFLGIVITMLAKDEGQSSGFFIGAISCILGAVSYGAFTALNRKFVYDKCFSMMNNYFATFVITTVINAVNGELFIPNMFQCAGIAWNGIVTMAIASTLWILALENGKTEKISNLAYTTPFLSMVWMSVFLKEKLSIYSIIGITVIVIGIFVQLKQPTSQKPSGQ